MTSIRNISNTEIRLPDFLNSKNIDKLQFQGDEFNKLYRKANNLKYTGFAIASGVTIVTTTLVADGGLLMLLSSVCAIPAFFSIKAARKYHSQAEEIYHKLKEPTFTIQPFAEWDELFAPLSTSFSDNVLTGLEQANVYLEN